MKVWKEQKYLPLRDLLKIQKNIKIYREEPMLKSLFIELQPGIACKKTEVKFTRSTLWDAFSEILTEALSCKFWKNYEHGFEHLCETASKIMSKREFVV